MKCQRKETLQTDSKTKENNIEQTIHWSKYNKKIRLQNHQSSTDRNSISIQEIDWWSKSLDKSFWTQKDLRLTYQDARGKVIEPKTNTVKWAVVLKCIKNSPNRKDLCCNSNSRSLILILPFILTKRNIFIFKTTVLEWKEVKSLSKYWEIRQLRLWHWPRG